jgi:hypothetical protein
MYNHYEPHASPLRVTISPDMVELLTAISAKTGLSPDLVIDATLINYWCVDRHQTLGGQN